MRAGVIYKYGKPEVIEVKEVKEPQLIPDGVLIKVFAISVNPIDCKIRKGMLKKHNKMDLPLILGYDVAGEVIAIGCNVKKFTPGDYIYGRLDGDSGGAYAQLAIAFESTIAKKPENISFYEAAAIPFAALTAIQALRDYAELKPGQQILINGASGGVGHFAIQLAKASGAIVTAVCSSRHNDLIEELKPDKFIDYTLTDFTKHNQKYDVIFDVIGNKNFLQCVPLLNKNGRYITTQPTTGSFMYSVISTLNPGKYLKVVKVKPNSKDLEILSQMVKENTLSVFVDTVFPLEALSQAHYYAENNHPNGKIAIDIGQ